MLHEIGLPVELIDRKETVVQTMLVRNKFVSDLFVNSGHRFRIHFNVMIPSIDFFIFVAGILDCT